MKPIALPLLVATLASLGASARATEPNLTLPVFYNSGLMSLGSRDSLLLLANELQSGISELKVEFFDADDDLLATKFADVFNGQTASISFSYMEAGTAAPLASVRVRITLKQEMAPEGGSGGDLPLPSRLYITLQHASQVSGISSAQIEGGCTAKAGPPLSGGGPDSRCFGALVVQDPFAAVSDPI